MILISAPSGRSWSGDQLELRAAPRPQRICASYSDIRSPLRAIIVPWLVQSARMVGQFWINRDQEGRGIPSSHTGRSLYNSRRSYSNWHHHWQQLLLPPVGLLVVREPGSLRPAEPRSGSHPAHQVKGGTTSCCSTAAVLVATLHGMLDKTFSHGRTNNLRMRHDRKIWYGSSLSRGDSRSTLFSPSSSSESCSSRWPNF